jgi:hypothetical protein
MAPRAQFLTFAERGRFVQFYALLLATTTNKLTLFLSLANQLKWKFGECLS